MLCKCGFPSLIWACRTSSASDSRAMTPWRAKTSSNPSWVPPRDGGDGDAHGAARRLGERPCPAILSPPVPLRSALPRPSRAGVISRQRHSPTSSQAQFHHKPGGRSLMAYRCLRQSGVGLPQTAVLRHERWKWQTPRSVGRCSGHPLSYYGAG